MTATAVIRNASAVVLAAETDRSLLNDDGTYTVTHGSKIYPVAANVAVVLSGTGGFASRPLSVIFSAACNRTKELAPVEVATDFLKSFVDVLTRLGVKKDVLTQTYVCGLLANIDKASGGMVLKPLSEVVQPASPAKKAKSIDAMLDLAEKFVGGLEDDPNLAPLDVESAEQYLLTLEAPSVGQHVVDDLGVEADVSELQNKRFAALIAHLSAKSYWSREAATLAFAGYGAHQFMPSICTLNLMGAIGDQVICSIEDDDPAANDELARIAMTAQSSAQEELVYGINSRDFNSVIDTSVAAAQDHLKLADGEVEKFGDNLSEKLGGYFRSTYSEPLLRAVLSMDVPSIARLADLLIRIQELRSMCSTSQSTVGGVIEVVSITKENGIRWHRKFDVDLDGGGSSVLG